MNGLTDSWLRPLFRLIFPRYCAICGNVICQTEDVVCSKCNAALPRTHFHHWPENRMEKMFWGKFDIDKATAYIRYAKGGDVALLVKKMKYKGRKDIATGMGRMMAREIMHSSDFFEGIDCIVPVPMHHDKQKRRGYNQAILIAAGVSEVTGIPVEADAVVRPQAAESQTHKSHVDRMVSMKDAFIATDIGRFAGRHVLIVDDIITTSATITACADALAPAPGIRFSVLTLAIAND